MKQITLTSPYGGRYDAAYGAPHDAGAECLGRFVMRWAFFGIGMWWIWSALDGSHALAWLIGLGLAFAMARKDLCA